MRILFTICGRAGSKGFKNKNLKRMNGVPLVYYTIAVIRLYVEKHPDDDIMVALNTDSRDLRDTVHNQHMIDGIKVVERKPELAGDRVAKVDVIRDTFLVIGDMFDAVVDLDITSPMRTVQDIENALEAFASNPDYDLVASVVEARRSPYFNMVEKRGDFYHKICMSDYTTRQESPKCYELNASIYVYSPVFLKREINNTILDNRCGVSVMKDYLVLDIDSEEDFRMMEFLHRYYCEIDSGIEEVFRAVDASVNFL